jgi:hypothetical protein
MLTWSPALSIVRLNSITDQTPFLVCDLDTIERRCGTPFGMSQIACGLRQSRGALVCQLPAFSLAPNRHAGGPLPGVRPPG